MHASISEKLSIEILYFAWSMFRADIHEWILSSRTSHISETNYRLKVKICRDWCLIIRSRLSENTIPKRETKNRRFFRSFSAGKSITQFIEIIESNEYFIIFQ